MFRTHPGSGKGRRWGVCLAAVLALHGAALAWIVHSEQSQQVARIRAKPGVSVRLLSLAAVAATPSTQAQVPEPHLAKPSPATGVSAAEAQVAAPDSDSPTEQDGYVPRRWLTVAPHPTAPVLLPFPSEFQERARYKAVLNLYIESDGRVGRVEFVGIALPDVLERAARNTFEHARFTPGQVKGRIVKSLIQIEVDFDALSAG